MLDTWLTGPEQFCSKDLTEIGPEVDYPLVSPGEDKDIRPEVSAFKADLSENPTPMEDRFAKFSSWDSLLSALSTLRHVSASYRGSNDCTGWHLCQNTKHESELKDMEHFILRCVQRQAFKAELEAIEGKHNLPRNSRIQDLSPYIDDVGLLRVGGRLNNLQGSGLASLNPVIVPNGHVATLLWRATYLESLQRRRKWCSSKQNLKTGDIVLLREKDVHRNMWPLGIVERPIESNDKLVRKAVIRVVKDGKVTTYTRPIAEMVLLLE
uniref:DUF5641 domain-containing protein n=1 Tax=Magallana gigas TaxID=29159 RepID=A0A8W8NGB0_MAGGI